MHSRSVFVDQVPGTRLASCTLAGCCDASVGSLAVALLLTGPRKLKVVIDRC